MSLQKRVAIIGAGFSGLTLARSLAKQGLDVEVFEARDHVGGLIQTSEKPVMVEYAAHAILASRQVEELFQDLQIEPERGGHKSKAKWIFRGKPRHWPFSFSESFKLIPKLLRALTKKVSRPQSRETLKDWTDRNSISLVQDFLFGPGFQGIYGTNSDLLSASLVLGGTFRKDLKVVRGKKRGSLAPYSGMHEIPQKLFQNLQSQGVKFHFNQNIPINELQLRFDAVVVATSMKSAASILANAAPEVSSQMSSLPLVSLTTVTLGFKKLGQRIRGFGCLFPRSEGFLSLGVLFNTDLFANRGELESETWILGQEASELSDSRILETILNDRMRLGAVKSDADTFKINRLQDALPMYGIELERFLSSPYFNLSKSNENYQELEVFKQGARLREPKFPLYLTGNYLGGIGLTKILSYNHRLAERISHDLRGKI